MSLFNYRTKKDTLEGLGARVSRLEKIMRNLKFWEVNDISQGSRVLRRRRVTPSVAVGAVGRGPWFDVDGLNREAIGSGTTSYEDFLFGFATPTSNTVTVNAGELQDSMLAVKAVASATVTVTNDPVFYIYVQYTYGSANTPTILGNATRPVMSATVYREILHTWTLSAGSVATLSRIYRVGSIVIPGTFATT